jgi:hypothetical protein
MGRAQVSADWLPPRRHSDSPTFGLPTPATKPETHEAPALCDLPPDDPTVLALMAPLYDAPALPPIDDTEETPPPFDPSDPMVLARKEQMRVIANADLARAYEEQRGEGDDTQTQLSLLRLRVLKLETDFANLAKLVRDDMHRRA